jgi:hypothetical protein
MHDAKRMIFAGALFAGLVGVQPLAGADLVAGPMVGHVTDKSARLWMEFPVAGQVTVTAFDVVHNEPVGGMRIGVEGPTPFVCDVPISGLQPNHAYRVEVKLNGETVKLPEIALRTAPETGEEATFTVAFGSGLDIAPMTPAAGGAAESEPVLVPHKLPIFRSITTINPRAFFFLGGMGKLPEKLEDFPTTHRAAYRFITDFHTLIRREPDMQGLLNSTPCYALFDERDLGPAGVDSKFVFLQESLVAFQRFWPNPDWGTPENPGCFFTCSFGDADFFMLDTRTFRSEQSLLGAPQLAWLEKGLKSSRASFKVIGASCRLFGGGAKDAGDGWAKYPIEQADFLKWLEQNRVTGLISLAGNQNVGSVSKFESAAGGLRYPIFMAGTSMLSPIAEARTAANSPEVTEAGKETRIGGAAVRNSFGTLDFGGQNEHRFVTLRVRDETGKAVGEQTVLAQQLRD